MPKQVQKSAVFNDLGAELNKAHKAVAGDDADYGSGGDLPRGIENGIARLKECKFAQYKSGDNEGKWYFRATGIVLFPETAPNGEPITNRTTVIQEPLCDVPASKRKRKTIGSQWQWIRNELLKLGLTKEEVTPKDPEKLAAKVKKARPIFGFRTWQGDKVEIELRDGKVFVGAVRYKDQAAAKAAHPFAGRDAQVVSLWKGICEPPQANPDVPEEAMGAMVDETEPAETPEVPEIDLAALAADADDNQSKSAAKKLQSLALEEGVSQEDIDNADSWAAVVEMFGEEATEEEPEVGAEAEAPEDTPNWEALGEDADAGMDDAIETLDEAGRAAGLDPDDYDSWAELAKLLAEDPKERETEDWMQVGNVVGFRGKTPGGRLTKAITEVEITAEDGGTFEVRNLDTGDSIEAVEITQLSKLE